MVFAVLVVAFALVELTDPSESAEIQSQAQVPHQSLEVDSGQETPEVEIADEAAEIETARRRSAGDCTEVLSSTILPSAS